MAPGARVVTQIRNHLFDSRGKIQPIPPHRLDVGPAVAFGLRDRAQADILRLDRTVVRRGRPGHTGKTRRTFRRGCPAANSLSRIFVRRGYRLDGLPYTIPNSMAGSLDCNAWGLVADDIGSARGANGQAVEKVGEIKSTSASS